MVFKVAAVREAAEDRRVPSLYRTISASDL